MWDHFFRQEPFPDLSAYRCQIWSWSVQPFGRLYLTHTHARTHARKHAHTHTQNLYYIDVDELTALLGMQVTWLCFCLNFFFLGSSRWVFIPQVLQFVLHSVFLSPSCLFCKTSFPFSFVLWCPLTYISSMLLQGVYLPPTYPNHFSLVLSLMFATPDLALISSALILSILFIPIIYLNILISVLSTISSNNCI